MQLGLKLPGNVQTRNFVCMASVQPLPVIISITSIKLKGPFAFFPFSWRAFRVVQALQRTSCKEFRKHGIWTTHYTMTLWASEQDMNDFVRSKAHLEAMKASSRFAEEIWLHTYEGTTLPAWPEAIRLLKQGRLLTYG